MQSKHSQGRDAITVAFQFPPEVFYESLTSPPPRTHTLIPTNLSTDLFQACLLGVIAMATWEVSADFYVPLEEVE